jgi:hypothetical protein
MKQQDIEELLQGRFQLDCPKIELIPCISTSKNKPLSGSGYISLNKDGYFDLKIYFIDIFPIDEVFEKLNWEPGKIIGDEAYYDLVVYDISGCQWKAERFIPDKNSGPYGSMIIGRILELRQIDFNAKDNKNGSIQFHFNEVIKVPLNTCVEEHETVGETTRKIKTSRRLARFEACGINFEIENNEGHTKLSAVSDVVEFTDVTINRIFESFRFVTSHSEFWSILVIRNIQTTETRIKAINTKKLKSRIPSPIDYHRIDYSESVWLLFNCYLKHVLANNIDYLHPIFKEVYSVIESGKASLDVEALILSVSIESLLREELNNFYKLSPELSTNICIAKKLILESDILDENFKNRMIGSLSNMEKARAKDILFGLRDNGLVDKELVKIYGNLRNKSAHGAKNSGGDMQNYFNQISAVLVLFFQLVFLIIEYNGEQTDYGTYGYPTKQFNGKLP